MSSFNIIKIVWKSSKSWIIFTTILKIINGFVPLGLVFLTRNLIINLSSYLKGNGNLNQILIILLFQFFVMTYQSISTNVVNILNTVAEKRLDFYIENEIARKASESPVYYFDNPNFYDHLQRIKYNNGSRFLNPIKSSLNLLQNLISFTSLIVYIWNIHYILALLCTITIFPVYIVEKKFGAKQFLLRLRETPFSRLSQYLFNVVTDRQSVLEIKLFNSKEYFLNRWSTVFLKTLKRERNLIIKRELALLSVNSTMSLAYLVSCIFIIHIIKAKKIQLGSFVAIIQAFGDAQKNLTEVGRNLSTIYNEKMYLNDLFNFLNYEDSNKKLEGEKDFPLLKEKGIEVRNFTFKYPQSNNSILKNISFEIKPGEKVLLVGENGSGKTTLIKCLMGLYPVENGKILYDGHCINSIYQHSLHDNISTVFQNYSKYALTVKENIALKGNLTQTEEKRMINVAKMTNTFKFISNFPNKFENTLGRIFPGGEELSGGQWQKIAIARTLYKDGQIFILDEPTSSLDPKAELEVFEQFEGLTKGKTSIYISHRMAAAKLADKIIVLKNGEIIGIGNHEELFQSNSYYNEMYYSQARWYA